MAMYTPLARRAEPSETRGQNSWVNFGPHAEANRTASGGDTVYAPQKIGLLPQWVVDEGRGDSDIKRSVDRPAVTVRNDDSDMPEFLANDLYISVGQLTDRVTSPPSQMMNMAIIAPSRKGRPKRRGAWGPQTL